jgi:hypothetical protein
MELAELRFGEMTQLFGRLEERGRDRGHDVLSLGRECDRLDTSIVLGVAALDETARLEPIDDAGHVRGVAPERVGHARHRASRTQLKKSQEVRLRERHVEARGDGRHSLLARHDGLEHRRPNFAGDTGERRNPTDRPNRSVNAPLAARLVPAPQTLERCSHRGRFTIRTDP